MDNDGQASSPHENADKHPAPGEVTTGGGLYVGGNVATDGGGFTGRDKIRSKTVNVYNAPVSPSTLITTTQLIGLVVLFIVAVAVPVVVILLFWTYLQTHATLTIWLLVAWVFLVLIGSASLITWLDPDSHLSQTIHGWLVHTFGGYRGKYLQHLTYRHRDFDVKGLSTQGTFTLQLDYVFVELRIAAQNPVTISSNPIHKSSPVIREQLTLWECLHREAWCYIAIIGPPGSGKTTLLKHAVLVLASGRRRRQQLHAPTQLPILLFLRDHIQPITTRTTYNLTMAIEHDLTKHGGPPPPPAWFARCLTDGKGLVLLDGLDEVADADKRKRVSEWVDRQILQYAKNRFVITSRPQGYHTNPLERVRALLEVQPFSQPQIEHFVTNWYYANEIMSAQRNDPGVTMKAKEGAQDLLHRLRTGRALSDLAVNPLLLTMIATVHRYRSSLPGRRVELYAEVCEVFLGKRQAAKGIQDNLTPAQKKFVLQKLALHLMQSGRRELPGGEVTTILAEPVAQVTGRQGTAEVTDFLDLIEAGSGLLLQREQGIYSFAHLAFQEYLTAVQVIEQKAEQLLLEQLANPWWQETIRLYSAQADASAIIEGCLAAEEPPVQALVLALECIEEARQVRPDLRDRLTQFFSNGVEATEPTRRHLLAEVMLALRQHRLVRIDQQTYIDPTYLTHAEYQLFLDEMQTNDQYYQPDHWPQTMFPTGQGLLPIVGIRSSDASAFCSWLSKRVQRENWRVRLPKNSELAKYQLEQAEGEYGTVRSYWVQTEENEFYLTDPLPPERLVTYYISSQLVDDLSFAIEVIVTSARDRAYALGRALDHVLILEGAVARDIALDIDLTGEVARAVDLDLARASARARDFYLHLASAGEGAGEVARAVDLARTLASTLALAHALARAGDLARTFALDPPRALARARALDLARTLASALASTLTHALDLDPARDLDLARTVAGALKMMSTALPKQSDIDQIQRLTAYHKSPLTEVITSSYDRNSKTFNLDKQWLQHWQARIMTFFNLVNVISRIEKNKRGMNTLRRSNDVPLTLDDEGQAYRDIYINLALLEARLERQLPAYEGIRLVWEYEVEQ